MRADLLHDDWKWNDPSEVAVPMENRGDQGQDCEPPDRHVDPGRVQMPDNYKEEGATRPRIGDTRLQTIQALLRRGGLLKARQSCPGTC